MRINAGVRQIDASFKYSHFIAALNKANIKINRKMMAELAVNNPTAFKAIVDKSGLGK